MADRYNFSCKTINLYIVRTVANNRWGDPELKASWLLDEFMRILDL